MIRYSKEEIIKTVTITSLASKFSISLEQINSGNFTHRCKCPSAEHKNGSERTGSLYIDDVNNNFYCFGCGASNNAIDFYILCKAVDFSTAIYDLSEFVDPTKIGKASKERKAMNFSQLLQISNCFRDAQKQHPDDAAWIERLMKKTDGYIKEVDRYDVHRTKALLRKIKDAINRRYSNK